MSAITIENDLVHYEVLGRGRPVILIHGWLGSWRYWIPTMQQLSMKYRIYALDLWGFGDSQKNTTRYGFKSQVTLLGDFMDKLGIAKAALVGHALGAAIALEFATAHPDRAPRIMLVDPPLFDLGGLPAALTKTSTGSVPVVTSTTPPDAPVSAVSGSPAHKSPITVTTGAPVSAAATASTTTASGSASPTTVATAPEPQTDPLAAPKPPASLSEAKPAETPTSPAPDRSDTLRHNPFLDHPELLAQLGFSPSSSTPTSPAAEFLTLPPLPPPTVKVELPNPLLEILNAAKPRILLERYIARGDENLEKLRSEVEKMDENVLSDSAKSFTGVNLALQLHRLTVPVLLLHGKDDAFLPPNEDLIGRIAANKADGLFLPLVVPDLRHFPMLESTVKFNRLLTDFLEISPAELANVQLKETWRRQLR